MKIQPITESEADRAAMDLLLYGNSFLLVTHAGVKHIPIEDVMIKGKALKDEVYSTNKPS